MSTRVSKGTQGKLIIIDWDELQTNSDENALYLLTYRQANALIAIAEYLSWVTRYENPPGIDAIKDFASETMYNLMNPILCDILTECIQPLLDAQLAEIISGINNLQKYGTETPGQPMDTEDFEFPLTAETNPTCDHDILWAQSLAVVQWTNRFIEDLFQQIESLTNPVELAIVFENLPVVTYITNFLGANFAAQLTAFYQEAVEEGYLAGYTAVVEQELACAVFCAAYNDCVISIDVLYSVFLARISAIVPDEPADLVEFLALLAGISLNSTIVVDVMFWMAWAGAKFGQFFIGDFVADLTGLTQLMAVSVNDANDDWILLCPVCPIEYCDEMASGLGAMTFEASSTNPYAQWDMCVVDYTGEVGGSWEASEGEDGNGAIVGVQVCASDPVSSLSIQQATVVIDLGAEFEIQAASMRFQNLDVGGSRSTIMAFFDGTGTFISDYGTGQTGSLDWRTFELVGTIDGCRYISFNNVNSAGGTPKIGQICVTYQG